MKAINIKWDTDGDQEVFDECVSAYHIVILKLHRKILGGDNREMESIRRKII